MEQLTLELASEWVTGIVGSGLACYASALAPKYPHGHNRRIK